jgi:hypothetical protein
MIRQFLDCGSGFCRSRFLLRLEQCIAIAIEQPLAGIGAIRKRGRAGRPDELTFLVRLVYYWLGCSLPDGKNNI